MKNNVWNNMIIAISLGLLANALWLYEIVSIIGWAGLEWLNHEHVSIFIINGLVNLAFLLPLWKNKQVQEEKKSKLIAFGALYCCTLLGYYAVKTALFGYDFLFGLSISHQVALLFLLMFPFFIYKTSTMLVAPIKIHLLFLLIIGVVFTCLASSYTLVFIPGYGGTSGFIDAVKMGYPYFWITVTMNFIGIITQRNLLSYNTIPSTNDDILDA